MTNLQTVIHYLALALAIFLIVSIIGGVVSTVGRIARFAAPREQLSAPRQYSVTDTVHNLTLEIGAAAVTVKTGDRFLVESNLPDIRVEVQDGCLFIVDKEQWNRASREDYVRVYLPKDLVFDKVDLITGAGDVVMEQLCTRRMQMKLGAGRLDIQKLNVTESGEISGGAGEISIRDGELHNVDFSVGVGSLELTTAVTGSCKIDCGVGDVEVTLLGTASDYRIDVQKGLGRAMVNGSVVSNQQTFGNGSNRVKVDGGIGNIEVTLP